MPPAQQPLAIITQTQQGVAASPLSQRSPVRSAGGPSPATLYAHTWMYLIITFIANSCVGVQPVRGAAGGHYVGPIEVQCIVISIVKAAVRGLDFGHSNVNECMAPVAVLVTRSSHLGQLLQLSGRHSEYSSLYMVGAHMWCDRRGMTEPAVIARGRHRHVTSRSHCVSACTADGRGDTPSACVDVSHACPD